MSASPLQRRASFGQTMRAVFWSFFGVRRSKDHAEDVEKLNPLHLAVAGVGAAIVFIVLLVLLVRWVVASGVAA